MTDLYTKNGRPLRRSGNDIFTASGKHVGRIQGSRVYGPKGSYVGTLVGDRVVYRSTDSATISSAFAPRAGAASAAARHAGSAIWGDEPDFPD